MIEGFQWGSRKPDSVRRPSTSDRWRALTYVVVGELGFLGFTAVSIAMHPGFVFKGDEGGLSDYGVHVETAIPYTLALILLAFYSRRAALLYADDHQRSRRLRTLLTAYCSVVLLVLLSTYVYTLNGVLKNVHFGFGTVLILVVGVGSIWMYRLWPPSIPIRLFLAVQLSGDVLTMLTVVGAVHLLFLSEMLSNIGFASLLVGTCRRIAAEEHQVHAEP
jgi:hypothetical protein